MTAYPGDEPPTSGDVGPGTPVALVQDVVERLERQITELSEEVDALRSQRDSAWAQLTELRRSVSWRVTAPLRRVKRLRIR